MNVRAESASWLLAGLFTLSASSGALAQPRAPAPPETSELPEQSSDPETGDDAGVETDDGGDAVEAPAPSKPSAATAPAMEQAPLADPVEARPVGFPPSGSAPGSPSRSYEERRADAKTSPRHARGWAVEPGVESEDYVLFPARALLFPPKLILELAFTPIELLLTGIDRHKVIPRVVDFFYFDQAHTAGFYPVVGSETGYGFSYGAKVFHHDALGHGESVSLAGRGGGRYLQAYEAAFDGDRVAGSRLWLETRARYEVQPAMLFFGFGGEDKAAPPGNLGPRDANVAVRYQQERFMALARLGGTLGEPGDITKLGMTAVYNHRVFGPEQRSFAEPSIERVYDTARIPGFDDHVNLLELDVNLVRDTRDVQGLAASGVYGEVVAGGVVPVDRYQYWHYGGELAGYIDLYRKTRVLVLRAAIEGVGGEEDEIPFVELPRLGGAQDLRGYLSDRFRDRMAAVATVEYRYPIHQLLSGKLFVDAGDVGTDPEALFGPGPFEQWKVGGGGGFLLHSEDSVALSLDLAYGDRFTVFVTTAPLEFFHNRSRRL